MKECPCRYCDTRKVGCHGKCIKYKSWSEEWVKMNSRIKQRNNTERLIIEDITLRKRRRMKK